MQILAMSRSASSVLVAVARRRATIELLLVEIDMSRRGNSEAIGLPVARACVCATCYLYCGFFIKTTYLGSNALKIEMTHKRAHAFVDSDRSGEEILGERSAGSPLRLVMFR
jgi:hypothetical protein